MWAQVGTTVTKITCKTERSGDFLVACHWLPLCTHSPSPYNDLYQSYSKKGICKNISFVILYKGKTGEKSAFCKIETYIDLRERSFFKVMPTLTVYMYANLVVVVLLPNYQLNLVVLFSQVFYFFFYFFLFYEKGSKCQKLAISQNWFITWFLFFKTISKKLIQSVHVSQLRNQKWLMIWPRWGNWD